MNVCQDCILVRTIAPYIAINMFHERKWVLYYRTHPTTRQPSAPERWKPIRSVGWVWGPFLLSCLAVSHQSLAWCETAKQLNKNGPQTTVPCTIGKWLKVWRTRSCAIIKSGELKIMMKHTLVSGLGTSSNDIGLTHWFTKHIPIDEPLLFWCVIVKLTLPGILISIPAKWQGQLAREFEDAEEKDGLKNRFQHKFLRKKQRINTFAVQMLCGLGNGENVSRLEV